MAFPSQMHLNYVASSLYHVTYLYLSKGISLQRQGERSSST